MRAGSVRGPRVVCVGGATLGGSGKTRVAIAAARFLADRGVRVVLVGHAYGARPGAARVVRPTDPLSVVGDEALVCAAALGDRGRVVVAGARQDALDHAVLLGADVIVVDGPLRIAQGTTLSLLAVDAAAPWGSGALPPAGDLRAPPAALLAAADHVIEVRAALGVVRWDDGTRSSVGDLAGTRPALFTALARPGRLAGALAELGVALSHIHSVADHGRGDLSVVPASLASGTWLATEKCALSLRSRGGLAKTARLGVLEDGFVLRGTVREALESLTCASPLHGTP